MKPKILFLSAPHYCEHFKQLLKYYDYNFDDLCTLDFYEYDSITDLQGLYRRFYNDYDGFCVTGVFSKRMLSQVSDLPAKPVQGIYPRSPEYYKEFFCLMNENRSINLKRVILDFSLWLDTYAPMQIPTNVEEFLNTNHRFSDIQSQIIDHTSFDEMLAAEENIVKNAASLIRENKADHIVCRFSTAYEKLQEKGIPCSFIYPTIDTIIDTMQLLVSDIRLTQMDSDLPAVLYITSEAFTSEEPTGINPVNLQIQQCLLEFDQEHTTNLVIRQTLYGYEVYTTQKILKDITNQFTTCCLKTFVFGRTGIDIQVGYGIGTNVIKARNNASAASRIAQREKKSYIINQNEVLIGPLEMTGASNEEKEISASILAAAKASHLSVTTIQRIFSVTEMLGSKELTTQALASSLQVTIANANRFLNALLKSGFAEITSEKKSYSKGRPSRIYKILL